MNHTRDLRGFIEFLEEHHPHEVIRIRKEVDPKFGVSGILARLEKDDRFPLVIFEKVKGSDIPLVANTHASISRLCLALGLEDADVGEFLKEYARREANPLEPQHVETGPVKEVILKGDDVDVTRLPICTYHEKDAGPYVTASLDVMKDPETGINNVGIYRLMLKDKNTFGIQISETSHGHLIWKQYEKRGEPTPMAAVIGHHPAFFLGALSYTPLDIDEFRIAGGMMRRPVRLTPCETIPLHVPADAEIVLECEILPHLREPEAPFGEYPGTYGPERMNPIVKVKAITMRENPLYQNAFCSHADDFLLGGFTQTAAIENTVRIACPTVKAVFLPPSGLCRFTCYIAIEKMIEGEAKQAAMAAFVADAYLKFVVVVDEDVDVTSDKEVLRAIATRVRADRDIFMITHAKGSPLDPASYNPAEGSHLVTKTGIDATRKANYPEEVSVPGVDGIDLREFIEDYEA